jgi:mannose-6-phosphate isomerase-like protein (cupin superfamily)
MKILILVTLAATAALAAADAPPAVTYKTEAALMAALKAGQATPDMLTSEVQNNDQHRINVVRRTKAAGAVAHPGFAELHHIIEGSGTLVTGGTIVDRKIQEGVARHLAKGDVVLVPSGVPHWYKDIDGTSITYLEVRWQEK